MKQYKFLNNIFGWLVFAIALFVYGTTVEPTASFWDCGEFIATAYKLQIGHPPGAPLFMIMGRIATLFAFGDTSKVAYMMNLLSALASAATILFLFWTITHLARKIFIGKDGLLSSSNTIAVIGCGIVGALAYTFSDTFWFSAVEGEVYATSSFFTAVVFWAMLKWEEVADEPYADRYIVLIAYLFGLSIGIHLLNLLAIPALAFIYYYKKYNPTKMGLFLTFLVGMFILGLVQFGIIPGVVGFAAKFELLFTNSLGLPFGSGAIFYFALLIALVVCGLYYTRKNGMPALNTALLCFTVMLIGYSSYGMILIRSSADTPMDENNPENVFTLLSYLNREQYGTRPLVYGQYYNAPLHPDASKRYKPGNTVYSPNKTTGKYDVIATSKDTEEPVYDPAYCTVFPRMWSSQPQHVRGYKSWSNIKGDPKKRPTFGENVKFFFGYQLGFMYFRYFAWNFVGRTNDIQGQGKPALEGGWKSGIPFFDDSRLGTQSNMPVSIGGNKANNSFYFLPLILGLIGMVYHYMKSKRDFSVVMLFYFFTGIAIIIFLNQYTNEPRERDYGFTGSFYAFSIWIGLGVASLYDFFKKFAPANVVAVGVIAVSTVAVPGLMAKVGWDDHDRSLRFTARDYASNYLQSCQKNAILFTNGDNDTFPLWYAQEVEGIRTDIRVVNLSLLNTDWYIDQIKRQAYDSDPVPISFTQDKYRQGKRDQILIYDENLAGFQDIREMMKFVESDDAATKFKYGDRMFEYFPSKNFSIPVDSAAVIKNGTVAPELASRIVKSINFTIDRNYILKADLMILDLLATNNWNRPVYFAITVGDDSFLGLQDYFQLEGLAYRLVPVQNPPSRGDSFGRVASNIMYDNVMNKFKWGGVDKNEVYMDENNQRMTMNLRSNFDRLASALISEGKKDSAVKVLDKAFEVLPEINVPYNFFVVQLAEDYYQCDEVDKADKIMKRYADIVEQELTWYFSQKPIIIKDFESEIQRNMSIFKFIADIARRNTRTELSADLQKRFGILEMKYSGTAGGTLEAAQQ